MEVMTTAVVSTTTVGEHAQGKGSHMDRTIMRALHRVWISGLVMLAVLPMAGWAQSSPPAQTGEGDGPVNAMCPVTTDEPIDPRFIVEYEGHVVGFCCRKCRTKFEQEPGAYLHNLPVTFTQDEREHAHDHADDEHDGGAAPAVNSLTSQPLASADDEHAHSHDTGERPRIAVWIGKLHPPATHLPIGLLIGAVIAELGVITNHRSWFRHTAGFCLALATIGAVIAATLGWFNGGFVLWDDDWVQATHRWLGSATAGLSLVALILFARATRPGAPSGAVMAYRVGLFVTTGLVGMTGFFGGALVYGIDHYAW